MNIEERSHLRRCITETTSAIERMNRATAASDMLEEHLAHLLEAERIAVCGETMVVNAEPEWIEWKGGDCPVKDGQDVGVRFRYGDVERDRTPEAWRWSHIDSAADIVAYRVWG